MMRSLMNRTRVQQLCLILLILVLAVGLTGCFAPESSTDLVGTYLAEYPDGSEELTLADDGVFRQVIHIDGRDEIRSEGTWQYGEDGYLRLKGGFLVAHDPSGKLRPDVEAWRFDSATFPVEQWPLKAIWIGQSEHYSYEKQD